MRKIAAIVLLLAACVAPNLVNADGMEVRHWRHIGRGCGFAGRFYRDGEFCTLDCEKMDVLAERMLCRNPTKSYS